MYFACLNFHISFYVKILPFGLKNVNFINDYMKDLYTKCEHFLVVWVHYISPYVTGDQCLRTLSTDLDFTFLSSHQSPLTIEASRPLWFTAYHHHTTTTVLWPFFRDHSSEPMPEENFWTLWCKGRLTRGRHTDHPDGHHSIRMLFHQKTRNTVEILPGQS